MGKMLPISVENIGSIWDEPNTGNIGAGNMMQEILGLFGANPMQEYCDYIGIIPMQEIYWGHPKIGNIGADPAA